MTTYSNIDGTVVVMVVDRHRHPIGAERSDRMTLCQHPAESVSTGPIYQYCKECGAVRYAPSQGHPNDEWHTCEKCRL